MNGEMALAIAPRAAYDGGMPDLLQRLLDRVRPGLPPGTDAFRLSDGSPWEGVFVDVLADRVLVSTRDRAVPRELLDALRNARICAYRKRLERGRKSPPVQVSGPDLPPRFAVSECGVLYRLDLSAGYSQGLFLDQRDNRRRVRGLCRPGMKVLNTFAYTGAFSVCAALGGAETTTLDLAQPCLDWCRENFRLNGLAPERHHFCRGDALHWLERFARQGRRFHGIILDPPTFSRGVRGKIWRAERDYGALAAAAARCLAAGGWLLCTTNCRKLSPAEFRAMIARALPRADLEAAAMPFDFSGEAYLKTLWCRR